MAEINKYEVDGVIHVTHMEVMAHDEDEARRIAEKDLGNRFPQSVQTHMLKATRVRMLAEGVLGDGRD